MIRIKYSGFVIFVDGATWVKTPYAIEINGKKLFFESMLKVRNYIDRLKK